MNRFGRFISKLRDSFTIRSTIKKTDRPEPVTRYVKPVGVTYNGTVWGSRGGTASFKPPEYNLADIANALDTESYFRRAVEKYIELIWKNGYTFIGKNPSSVRYINRRFSQIAQVTNIPTRQLFEDIAQQLVPYANCFIAKVRSNVGSGGNNRITFDGREKIPIAGYFVIDATSMLISKEINGKVKRYKQYIPGIGEEEWNPENMIHIFYSRKVGLSFGTPMVVPVMDDMRALRRMEENIEILVFQHSVPLYQYIIGTESSPSEPQEVTNIQSVIKQMPTYGAIVTPERHKIEIIGAEGEALDASKYLDYFKRRVFAGLGMSAVVMGEGQGASKSSATNITIHMHNTVEKFQQIIKTFIDEYIIKELLGEGGFIENGIGDDDGVEILFPPIDQESRNALENHVLGLYQGNLITEDEARLAIGRDILKNGDRKKLNYQLIQIPLALIKSMDEDSGLGKSQPGISNGSPAAVKSKSMPTNQHGTKQTKPRISANDNRLALLKDYLEQYSDDNVEIITSNKMINHELFDKLHIGSYVSELCKYYMFTKDDTIDLVDLLTEEGRDFRVFKDRLKHITDITYSQMNELTINRIGAAYRLGLSEVSDKFEINDSDINLVKDKSKLEINTLIIDLNNCLYRKITHTTKFDSVLGVSSIFDSLKHRLDLLGNIVLSKSYNLGKYRAIVNNNRLPIINNCNTCSAHEITTCDIYNELPPYNNTCTCSIVGKENK